MVDVTLTGLGRAIGVGEVLIEVIAEVTAPYQMSAQVTVSEADGILRLIGEEGEGENETFVALTTGDGALDQPLTKEFEDAIVGPARIMHPG